MDIVYKKLEPRACLVIEGITNRESERPNRASQIVKLWDYKTERRCRRGETIEFARGQVPRATVLEPSALELFPILNAVKQ